MIRSIVAIILIALTLTITNNASTTPFDCGDSYFDDPYCHGEFYDEYLVAVPLYSYANLHHCVRPECLVEYQVNHGMIIKGYIWGVGNWGESSLWYIVWNGDYDLYVLARQVELVGWIYGEHFGSQIY
jgi:hypothetical protein